MATMVREKRRDKMKTKEKHTSKSSVEHEQPSVSEDKIKDNKASLTEVPEKVIVSENPSTSMKSIAKSFEGPLQLECNSVVAENTSHSQVSTLATDSISETSNTIRSVNLKSEAYVEIADNNDSIKIKCDSSQNRLEITNVGDTYHDLNSKLERMSIPSLAPALDIEEIENRLISSEAYVTVTVVKPILSDTLDMEEVLEEVTEITEDVLPSAPVFEEQLPQTRSAVQEVMIKETKPKVQCMPLEEAVRVYGGAEISEVMAMSEREETLVEAGPVSGPEHPLVDLLSTFRCSLTSVERERTQLAHGFAEEEKFRTSLWKVEKRHTNVSEKCPCGASIDFRAVYEHAELLKERLPVAKMRLESLLRDVQDSYCHHQHAALLAHCQIEELISETIQSNKGEIREALALILQELRLTDSGPTALAAALQRWANVLSVALLDGRDLRQLLHLLHHLFRQARSVRWAARVVRVSVVDRSSAARALALLDVLLARPRLEAAVECTEDTEEAWEEVDKHGEGSAVTEGTLREGDLLALLRAFPMRDLLARLVLFTHADISRARAHEWGDAGGGRGVARACCGVRALLATLRRGARAHAPYARLRARLRALAARALHALAGLHLHTRDSYSKDMEDKITAELEASFSAGVTLCGAQELHKLPATLLSDAVAKDYCIAIIVGLHDTSPKLVESLSLELPALACGQRVRVVAHAALGRLDDHDLARIALEVLFDTGIKRKASPCKGTCESTARQLMPSLLAAHPYLHTLAFHLLADLNQAETLEASAVKPLSVDTWRPNSGEVRAVLDDWSQRCVHLLQYLLLDLEYTPHVGVSLDTQLAIGSWLCHWLRSQAPPPEWAWLVLRRMRPHRAYWGFPLDAPAPDEATDLFSMAYAVVASSWGHCIPLICSDGVSALCKIAAVRARDAIHCLAPVMLVMAHSPESVTLTPKFKELFSILLVSGPSLVQRALGRGPAPGCDLLLGLLLAQLEGESGGTVSRSALISAWLHALWRVELPTAGLLDAALLASREWPQFDAHAGMLLQDEHAKEMVSWCVREAWRAPQLCECALRAAHARREAAVSLCARLHTALRTQRAQGHRIHVDNALKQIGVNMSAEELVIYRTATAVTSAPLQHPGHLMLWRLFFHLYLQRPPDDMQESTPPTGPLFFSGLIKSRTLGQLKKRLQDTITYHHTEAESYNTTPVPQRPLISETPVRSKEVDENLLPTLTIADLTGESSESSDSESSASEEAAEGERLESQTAAVKNKDAVNMLCYHTAAEKLAREYSRWLDEGEKTRAMPHHADIARFISEPALDAAWSNELARRRPPATEEPYPHPAPPRPPPRTPRTTPFDKTVSMLLKIRDRSWRRLSKPDLKSPVDDVNFNDTRAVLKLVDKHLEDIEKLAQEWSSEVGRVTSLDARLWELVSALRVRRPLPPVSKACASRCTPRTLLIPEEEWCISTGAERGIQENRRSAHAAVRRVARARPLAARTAAALHALARRIGSAEAARGAGERAWRCAGAAGGAACAPAHAALRAFVGHLAERWLSHDGKLCAELVARWGGNTLQQALCGALVSPRRLRSEEWPPVYAAVLRASLPSHATFSYLSKFEMGRWAESAAPAQRREVLDALDAAALRRGPAPEPAHHVLLELIGVHTAAVTRAPELGALVTSRARAAAARLLPPAHLAHVNAAAARHACQVPFDQLGHLLRELGVVWWEARAALHAGPPPPPAPAPAAYALHTGALLCTLQRAFVAAAHALSYAPERVALYSWSSLQESWAPWVRPHPAVPPLLPSTVDEEAYTPMLKQFVDTVHQIMLDYPGTEEYLLQQIFEWVIETHSSVLTSSSQESRVQLSALLVELAKLPWTEHQWLHGPCLQSAVKICSSTDKEITAWCGEAWRGVAAATWLRGAGDDHVAPRLATLLYLFTAMPHPAQTLDEATRLPWWRLPEAALEEAMERFFAQYHDPSMPYHDLPQFRVIVFASELAVRAGGHVGGHAGGAAARLKRARGVAQWTRAACAPALQAHVPAHAAALLAALTHLAPHLEGSEGELEELLSRAVVIMCLEPAATAALPAWLQWVASAAPRMVRACLSAACALTAPRPHAALADAAARAYINSQECSGWSEVAERWRECAWSAAAPLVLRGRLHAAYGAARASPARAAPLHDLLAASLHFVEDEVIIAVWICVACRVAGAVAVGVVGEVGEVGEEGQEAARAARALLLRWGAEPRRSLYRVLTLHHDTATPTAQHRLLCRFAQCVLTPDSDSAVAAYEASCTAVLGSTCDVLAWGKAPRPKRLPRLAMLLYPNNAVYFKDELDLASDVTT